MGVSFEIIYMLVYKCWPFIFKHILCTQMYSLSYPVNTDQNIDDSSCTSLHSFVFCLFLFNFFVKSNAFNKCPVLWNHPVSVFKCCQSWQISYRYTDLKCTVSHLWENRAKTLMTHLALRGICSTKEIHQHMISLGFPPPFHMIKILAGSNSYKLFHFTRK